MCDTPIETTRWSPAKKWNGEEVDETGGRGVIVTIVQIIDTEYRIIQ